MTKLTWRPTRFTRFEESLDTSMGTVRISTDAGKAYVKALGNRQGPHPLACELVASQLAQWFGLPTFDFAVITIDAAVDEIPFLQGGAAESGSAFVTREAIGNVWGGKEEELDELTNPEAVSHLVVFDTWTRNCDRHSPESANRRPNYDNVFLQRVAGEPNCSLVAMDHTHCFTCGRDLDRRTSKLEWIKDEGLYGLFPAFVPRVRQKWVDAAIDRLREVDRGMVARFLREIPEDWQVDAVGRLALEELIVGRAAFVAGTISDAIARRCWPDKLFDQR